MKPAIHGEDILRLMAYGLDLLSRPTIYNWNQSYEGWLHRHDFPRRMHWLESQGHVRRQGNRGDWVYRLTEKGRASAGADFDPEKQWHRKWDGWWRQLIFDLPAKHKKARQQLIRWLRLSRFGYLQDSVWIHPDPVKDMTEAVRDFRNNAESFTMLQSRCVPGFSDAALVRAAWPFDKIREGYEAYVQFTASACLQLKDGQPHPRDLFRLLRDERLRWATAIQTDPLLPRVLWPEDYHGEKAWRARRQLLRALASQFPR